MTKKLYQPRPAGRWLRDPKTGKLTPAEPAASAETDPKDPAGAAPAADKPEPAATTAADRKGK